MMDYDNPDPRAEAHIMTLAAIAALDPYEAGRNAEWLAYECRCEGYDDWTPSRHWGDEFFLIIRTLALSLMRHDE